MLELGASRHARSCPKSDPFTDPCDRRRPGELGPSVRNANRSLPGRGSAYWHSWLLPAANFRRDVVVRTLQAGPSPLTRPVYRVGRADESHGIEVVARFASRRDQRVNRRKAGGADHTEAYATAGEAPIVLQAALIPCEPRPGSRVDPRGPPHVRFANPLPGRCSVQTTPMRWERLCTIITGRTRLTWAPLISCGVARIVNRKFAPTSPNPGAPPAERRSLGTG